VTWRVGLCLAVMRLSMIKPPGAACLSVKHSTLACALDRDYHAPSYASADTHKTALRPCRM
jgi:hypothetical protein